MIDLCNVYWCSTHMISAQQSEVIQLHFFFINTNKKKQNATSEAKQIVD